MSNERDCPLPNSFRQNDPLLAFNESACNRCTVAGLWRTCDATPTTSCSNCIRAGLGDRCRRCVRPLSERLSARKKQEKDLSESEGLFRSTTSPDELKPEQSHMDQQPVYQSKRQQRRIQRKNKKNCEREKVLQRPQSRLWPQDSCIIPLYPWSIQGQVGVHPWHSFDNQGGLFPPTSGRITSQALEPGVSSSQESRVLKEREDVQSVIERLLNQTNHDIGTRWRSQSIAAGCELPRQECLDQCRGRLRTRSRSF